MTTQTATLADFLLARVAEDEAKARACTGPEWTTGLPATIHPDPTTYRTVTRAVGHVCGSIIAADAEHIARWDPARVLAECEAKRRIVVRCQEMQSAAVPMAVHLASRTLADLALPYADHPDYREEYRP